MGCEFSVAFPDGVRGGVEAGCAALDEVERLEGKLSVYREDSDISRVNRAFETGAACTPDGETGGLLRQALRLAAETGGAFDPAAGALVKAWGFFRGPKRVPEGDALAAALERSGWNHILIEDAARTRRAGVELNLGAIGKGYAIDRALEVVRRRFGIGCALMQGGQSSLRAIGAPPGGTRGWTVAIGDPLRSGRTLALVRLRDRALGTSAADHQFFIAGGRRYGHVLDPRTGRPASGMLSASAVAPTAAEADALSTAFFVMGVEGARRFCDTHRSVSALLVAPGKIHRFGEADMEVTV
jgi:FAD:protein FMN transferase